MKKKIRSILMLVGSFVITNSLFAQADNGVKAQNEGSKGTLVGRAIRSCFGGNTAKAEVYAVINRADWCLVCKQNSERVEGILPEFKTKPIAFIPNDITDGQTSKSSTKYLKKLHIYEAVLPVKETGVMILINAKTHQVINKISLAESNQNIEAAINNSLNNSAKI